MQRHVNLSSLSSSIIFLFFFLIQGYSPLLATEYFQGEKLEFNLSWGGIPAGKMTMEIAEETTLDGHNVLHIVSNTWSNKIVSTFYKLNNRVDSYADKETFASLEYRVATDSKGKKKTESASYNYAGKKMEHNKNGIYNVIPIPSPVCDSLSSFYYMRTLPLVIGKEVRFNTFSGGKVFDSILKPVDREKLTVEAGSFDTIKIYTMLKDGDVLKSSGDSFIWLSDDERRIPVKIKTKIKVGHITAELAGYRAGKTEKAVTSPSVAGQD